MAEKKKVFHQKLIIRLSITKTNKKEFPKQKPINNDSTTKAIIKPFEMSTISVLINAFRIDGFERAHCHCCDTFDSRMIR